jgi:hypothetical protein
MAIAIIVIMVIMITFIGADRPVPNGMMHMENIPASDIRKALAGALFLRTTGASVVS